MKTTTGENPFTAFLELTQAEREKRGLLHTPQEIMQQPETWAKTYSLIERRQGEIAQFLSKALAGSPTVYLVGAGTSDYIGRALTSVLRLQWQCEVLAVPSTELVTNMESYVLPGRPYLWISFSRSGDSSEGVGVLEAALRGYPAVQHLVVTCNKDGAMSRLCEGRDNAFVLVLDDAVNDRGLAMTSSFTNMVVAGHCLAHAKALKEYRATLDALIAMGRTMLEKGGPLAQAVAKLGCKKACYVGSGALAAAATECALKTLELTAGSIATMAESTMGLRHGPMSALDDDTLIVCFVSSDARRRRYEEDLLKEIHEKQLGRVTVAVVPDKAETVRTVCDHVIELHVPANFPDDYRVPVDVILGQLIGLFSSLEAGLQPDCPSPNGAINRVVSHVRIYS